MINNKAVLTLNEYNFFFDFKAYNIVVLRGIIR